MLSVSVADPVELVTTPTDALPSEKLPTVWLLPCKSSVPAEAPVPLTVSAPVGSNAFATPNWIVPP